MARALLLGAGLGSNWGGWLASEPFEYLLGCPQVDADIRNLLWPGKRKADAASCSRGAGPSLAKHRRDGFDARP